MIPKLAEHSLTVAVEDRFWKIEYIRDVTYQKKVRKTKKINLQLHHVCSLHRSSFHHTCSTESKARRQKMKTEREKGKEERDRESYYEAC